MSAEEAAVSSVVVDASLSLVGQNLRGFIVESLVGAGGMGEVYLARHETLPKPAAVKVLKADMAADQEWKRRFVREAEAVSSLNHPGIVQLYNFGTLDDGRQYLVMEFIDGQPLDALIARRGSLSPFETLNIAEQVLDGLAEAHKAGVVHRDLKPANVILEATRSTEPRVKLVDFGLARRSRAGESGPLLAADVAAAEEKSSLLAGTPHYMAPEQALGRAVDGRADVYSLGVMLYEMLSGRLPFEDQNLVRLLDRQVREAPVPLEKVAGHLPPDVAAFVDSLLVKSPEDRPSAEIARHTVKRLCRGLAEEGVVGRTAHGAVHLAPTRKVAAPTTLAVRSRRASGPRSWLVAIPVVLSLGGAWLASNGGGDLPAESPPHEAARAEPPAATAERPSPADEAVVRKCNKDLTAYSEQLELDLRARLDAEARGGEADRALKPLRTLRQSFATNRSLKGCQALDEQLDRFGEAAGL